MRRMFEGGRRDDELQEELRAFVDDLTARNIARGMPPEAARRAALAETGGVDQVRELTREQWRGQGLETVGRDIRHGLRLLARTPVFALVVIGTLALVIGATATVFSVMHAVLWRPLPYPAADRLVVVDAAVGGVGAAGLSGDESRMLLAEPDLFERLARVVSVDAHVDVDGEMERVPAAGAGDDAFRILGAEPLALGRPLDAARDGGITSTVRGIVISHELWMRRLHGDPAVVGRHIQVNNLDVEVVGVLAPGFRVLLPPSAAAPEVVDVWFPRGFETDDGARGQISVARLRPGVSAAAAQARLDALALRFVADKPSAYPDGALRLSVRPLHDLLTEGVARALWILAGSVGFVLLIGCVNVANLMLVRARTRAHEMAVRRALGASQGRLLRQLFTETAVLTTLGAAAGLLVAHAGVDLIDWLRPAHLPRQATIAVTTEAALFVAGLAALVSLVFGLVPAFASAGATHGALRSGRVAAQRPGAAMLQRGLVVAEVALSIVPLVAAGLMLHTFLNLTLAPIGFRTDGIVTAKMATSFRAFPEIADRWRVHRDALERIRQLPGVDDVSAGGPLPFDDWRDTRVYGREGDGELLARATAQAVLPGYLRVTGTRLLAGREFTLADIDERRQVVIIDERMAAQLWPDGAVGQRLVLGRGRRVETLEVVGVSEALRVTRVRDEATPNVILPYHLFPTEQALVIRTAHDAAAIGPLVKHAVESLGTQRPVYDIRPMQSYVDASIGDTRFLTLILAGFAMASIALAAVGLYGTLSYLTAQRTQEFGIRMALGASGWCVLRGVAGEGLVLAGIGAAIGFAGAVAVADTLGGLLYDVAPLDATTLVAVAAAVALTALAAATHPAWRAGRIDPVTALRAE